MKYFNKNRATAELLSLIVITFCGCSSFLSKSETDSAEQQEEVEISDFTKDAEAWADSVLNTMTLQQKIGQFVMPSMYASSDEATVSLLHRYVVENKIGGVVLLKGSPEASAFLSDTLRRISKVIPFVAVDAEWGLAMRMPDTPKYPRFSELGKGTATDTLMFDYGAELGRELSLAGFNMLLGPVMDVDGGKKGVIGSRSLGDDPERVADLGVAYALGVESRGIITVSKHFPGHGGAADSHRSLPVVNKSRQYLDSVDLMPFRAVIANGLSAIMVGHISMPALGDSLPAAVSRNVMQKLLRREMKFRGLILTDALNMGGVKGYGAADAIIAGADIVLAPENTQRAVEEIESAVIAARISMEEINEKCRRILFYKYLVQNSALFSHHVSATVQINNAESQDMLERLDKHSFKTGFNK